MRGVLGILFLLLVVLNAAVALADDGATSAGISFDRQVRPILQKCIGCHGPDRPKADLDLTERPAAIELGAIVPHDAGGSSLIERVTSDDPEFRMPPDGALSEAEVRVLRQWIDEGAAWPIHWAYRRLSKPRLPCPAEGTLTAWCRNPIDRFVAARLADNRLQPSPLADRRTRLRRVYYDLLGVPPSAEETARFEADRSPDAYERIVERLLASPQYGERWARHWMDQVHFAETHGHDQDRPREHAWPYRDYLIDRLNQDVPYARFVQEQIAGDILFPDDPGALVGTGFLAAGPWDESSLRDIQEDSIDRQIGRYLDRDDIVTTVMSSFLSTSAHCARCHHHKFDPISQDEYYGLQAVFAATDKANREYDPDPAVTRQRQSLRLEAQQIAAWAAEQNSCLLDAQRQAAVAQWELNYRQTNTLWQPLELIEFKSSGGATLTAQDDHSIYAEGDRPEKDSYRIVARARLPRVRAIRLAVLADERLPQRGPGRQDNGNLHLNEIRVFAVDANEPRSEQRLAIAGARADFNQSGWSVDMAIDGNPSTAWGIYPQVGQLHAAVFELSEELTLTDQAPRLLRIELDQVHGGGHLIGRFELSVTDDERPLSLQPALPGQIAAILSVDAARRTAPERMQLAAYVLQQEVERRLAALPEPAMVYCGTNQFAADGSFRPAAEPRVVEVLQRGEIGKPLRTAQPAVLTCMEGLEPDASPAEWTTDAQRRAALAHWISSPQNGLAWRSIANRLWHYHFGQPLVATPNDFGHAGSSPTHAELLDWLAATLQEHGGSLKSVHRLIVTSATYQQVSAHRAEAAQIDGNNLLLWRMNRSRLDAESFRDSLLTISETLDNHMGGPSDRQFVQSPGVHVTPVVDYQSFDVDHRSNYRRSVYRFIFRTVPDPFMEALDCPDASQLTPQRAESVTAIQALATMNDKFVIRQSELLAERIAAECSSLDDQVAAAYRRIFARPPTTDERVAVGDYIRLHGLPNACRLLLNTNEFMFVD